MKEVSVSPEYLKRQIDAVKGTYGNSTMGIYILVRAVEDILKGDLTIDGDPYYKRDHYQGLWAEETERERRQIRHKA